jgi:DNA-binding response OmpR family regulator/nitrogen-specific signal transduction histidine kinase
MKRVKLHNDLQLKNIEAEKLLEVDKLKSRFFANISHEFRTPLTLVLGLTEKLFEKTSEPENKKDFGVIRKNANRLLQLINQLLELSKLEAGSVNAQVTKIDINKYLKRILASFTALAEQKNINFTFNGEVVNTRREQEEVFLYIDPEKFETIVYNLTSNAFKFSPEGSKIEVEVTPHLHSVDIRFTNTGVGIPDDKLPFIFDRFYQVDETSSRSYEGTGIGLALVKELVELHNGEIKVMSIKDKETTFEIRIPSGRAHYKAEQVIDIPSKEKEITVKEVDVSTLAEETVSFQPKEKQVVTDSQSKIILVVEDNFDLRNYIIEQLEDKYTVFEAEDGEKGLQLATEILPDLIISDIMMPKMDGYQMSKRLKKDFKTSHIPIIMLTAKAAREDKMDGLEIGADDYLIKPFDASELLIRVKNLIRNREQMREKFRVEMTLKPREVIVPSSEKLFIEKVTDIIEKNIDKEKFGVDELSNELGLSRSQLHRKLKAITDQSTTEFIRNYRLKRAADLILQDAGNMAEIAYQVGFSSQAYFTKSFTELFGCSPGEYKKSKNS